MILSREEDDFRQKKLKVKIAHGNWTTKLHQHRIIIDFIVLQFNLMKIVIIKSLMKKKMTKLRNTRNHCKLKLKLQLT